jgi:menaquinone-dependent protoporphyrinogen oxidase
MMKKVLVTFTTHTGTTRDVAVAIAEEITKAGFESEVRELSEVKLPGEYAAVVMGAPMIMGWHREALKYLRKHNTELTQLPLAIFVTAMSLGSEPKPEAPGVAIHLDAKLALAPRNPKALTLKERYVSVKNYTRPILAAAPASLKAIGLFGGRLDYYRLKLLEVLFVMLVVGAKPGEKRDWVDIRTWAAELPAFLQLTK